MKISCLAATSVERGTGRLGFLSTPPDDDDPLDDVPELTEDEAGVAELDLVLGMPEPELGSKYCNVIGVSGDSLSKYFCLVWNPISFMTL